MTFSVGNIPIYVHAGGATFPVFVDFDDLLALPQGWKAPTAIIEFNVDGVTVTGSGGLLLAMADAPAVTQLTVIMHIKAMNDGEQVDVQVASSDQTIDVYGTVRQFLDWKQFGISSSDDEISSELKVANSSGDLWLAGVLTETVRTTYGADSWREESAYEPGAIYVAWIVDHIAVAYAYARIRQLYIIDNELTEAEIKAIMTSQMGWARAPLFWPIINNFTGPYWGSIDSLPEGWTVQYGDVVFHDDGVGPTSDAGGMMMQFPVTTTPFTSYSILFHSKTPYGNASLRVAPVDSGGYAFARNGEPSFGGVFADGIQYYTPFTYPVEPGELWCALVNSPAGMKFYVTGIDAVVYDVTDVAGPATELEALEVTLYDASTRVCQTYVNNFVMSEAQIKTVWESFMDWDPNPIPPPATIVFTGYDVLNRGMLYAGGYLWILATHAGITPDGYVGPHGDLIRVDLVTGDWLAYLLCDVGHSSGTLHFTPNDLVYDGANIWMIDGHRLVRFTVATAAITYYANGVVNVPAVTWDGTHVWTVTSHDVPTYRDVARWSGGVPTYFPSTFTHPSPIDIAYDPLSETIWTTCSGSTAMFCRYNETTGVRTDFVASTILHCERIISDGSRIWGFSRYYDPGTGYGDPTFFSINPTTGTITYGPTTNEDWGTFYPAAFDGTDLWFVASAYDPDLGANVTRLILLHPAARTFEMSIPTSDLNGDTVNWPAGVIAWDGANMWGTINAQLVIVVP